MASRKLKQYFQGHPITVVSSAPLGDIIQNKEATGQVAKWAIELGPCHAQYATLYKRNSKVPPRIDPHIETLLQGGYHYINIT